VSVELTADELREIDEAQIQARGERYQPRQQQMIDRWQRRHRPGGLPGRRGLAGSFSAAEAGLRFVLGAAGGVAIGLVGWVVAELRQRTTDTQVVDFLVDAVLFLLIGLQLGAVVEGLSGYSASARASQR
jgi:hypothetical protein